MAVTIPSCLTTAVAYKTKIMLAFAVFLLTVFQRGVCGRKAAGEDTAAKELYPQYTEYDPQILDPLHGYGSPYGGFSRATRQRLAALPLHLPEIMSSLTNGENEEEQEEDAQKPGEDPLYTTVRDGTTGQLFACRVYHEDELDPASLNDSMFDPPILVDEREPKKYNGSSSPPHRTPSSSTPKRSESSASEAGSRAGATTTTTTATTKTSNKARITTAADETESERVSPNHAQQAFTLVRMTQALEVLRGLCAQIHQGWWSYEWCYESSLAQFHVAIVKDAGIEIQDITNLGSFHRRDWMIDLSVEKKNPLAGDLREIARVQDTHQGGTICPDTNEPRQSVVNIVCCTDEIMAAKKALLRKGDTPVGKSDDLALYGISEDPKKICHYTVTICTPILCEKPDSLSPEKDAAKTASDGEKDDDEDDDDDGEEEIPDRTRHKQDESIMEILDRTLGGRKPVCLQSITGGWWTFEFCHGKSIRQYHEVVGTRRDKNGATQTTRVVETDHNLGQPQNSVFQAISPQDEWRYVVNATDKNGAKKPYFELEYTNGDICDDHDVRDSAIVAGNSGAKGLARSASVRYGCGETYDIVVNEDSTCHYVVNIAVPDLCRHPIFKTPVSKKQVFKCLPIDEPDVDESSFFF